jgi:hypothetical protein
MPWQEQCKMAVEFFFDEVLLDPDFFNEGAAVGSPEFANNNMRSPQTGVARVAVLRFDAQLVYNINFADIRYPEGIDYLAKFWLGGYGSAYGFRMRVEADFFVMDEVLGNTGSGGEQDFKLTRTYERQGTSGHPYIRRIIKPVVNTNLLTGNPTLYEPDGETERVIEVPFAVYLDDVALGEGDYTIDNTTGDLHLTASVANKVVAVDMQYDTPMQFWMNSFQQKADHPAEASGFQLIEILPASLGIE